MSCEWLIARINETNDDVCSYNLNYILLCLEAKNIRNHKLIKEIGKFI